MSALSFLGVALILGVALASQASAVELPCNSTVNETVGDSGSLIIKPGSECFFSFFYSKPRIVNVKLDKLVGQNAAGVVVHRMEPEPDAQYNFSAPFNPGYVHLTLVSQTRIVFTVDRDVSLEFNTDIAKLDIPCSQSSAEFDILLTNGTQKLDFNCIETGDLKSHVELARASFLGSPLHHKLVTSDFSIQPADTRVIVKTWPASPECSLEHVDLDRVALVAPTRKSRLDNLRCVNTFTLTTAQTHFDLTFQNLTDSLADQDSLTLDLGNPGNELVINKATESLFRGKTISSMGKHLAIIYHSVVQPKSLFNLTVESKAAGGLVQFSDATPLTLNLVGPRIRFILKPFSPSAYTLIQFPANARLTDANVTVSNGKQVLAYFEDTYLPATVTSNNPGETLILEAAGKSLKQLEGLKVYPVNSTCDKQHFETGSYSAHGAATSCLWTITSKSGVGLKVNSNDLRSNSCLSIRSLDTDSSNSLIYNKCNLTLTDILPTFNFRRAVVNVTLAQNARFDAVLVQRPNPPIIKSALNSTFNLTSNGYPLDYAVSTSNKSYVLYTGKQAYVVSVIDLDLREGEKLILNGTAAVANTDVIIPKNTTSPITVTKATKPGTSLIDSSIRRGFKLAGAGYDSIITSQHQSANISIPANQTSVYVKLSTEPGKKFNFTTSKIASVDVEVYDAPSMYGQKVKLNGSSTSNNLIFTISSKKGQTIPQLFVNYTVVPCNETAEHVCDNKTRCIPYVFLCKGVQFCDDGSDISTACNSSATIVKEIQSGMSSFSTFLLCMIMIAIGACCTLYGPGLYKMVDERLRGGQYSSFTSSE